MVNNGEAAALRTTASGARGSGGSSGRFGASARVAPDFHPSAALGSAHGPPAPRSLAVGVRSEALPIGPLSLCPIRSLQGKVKLCKSCFPDGVLVPGIQEHKSVNNRFCRYRVQRSGFEGERKRRRSSNPVAREGTDGDASSDDDVSGPCRPRLCLLSRIGYRAIFPAGCFRRRRTSGFFRRWRRCFCSRRPLRRCPAPSRYIAQKPGLCELPALTSGGESWALSPA